MRLIASLGAPQLILPPHRRPDLRFLKRIGFAGQPETVLERVQVDAPEMLSAAWSASAMWTANAATVSAAVDCRDQRTHLSIANLTSSTHRSLEPPQTTRLFRRIFRDPRFVVHPPLPATWGLRDEGAANHMRLFDPTGQRGLELFVYGDPAIRLQTPPDGGPFPARQSRAASRALARRHQSQQAYFLQQDPQAIAAGAFHNDVVATSCRDVLLMHDQAFVDDQRLEQVASDYARHCGRALHVLRVDSRRLSLSESIRSYLFNSQLIVDASDPAGSMTIICPQQVAESPNAQQVVETWINGPNPIDGVRYVELRESMCNGGGPACLRLRVPMTVAQWQTLPSSMIFSEALADRLESAIQRNYPEEIEVADLVRPRLLAQVERARDAIWHELSGDIAL